MSRLFRPIRNIIALSGRANPIQSAQSTQSTQPGVYRIQWVRVRRRRLKAMDIIIGGGIAYVCFTYFRRSLGMMAHEEGWDMTEEEQKEFEEEDLAPIFIPFPGFTRTIEPSPYRSTDPEWQTFLKVSRNRALQRTIREKLADMVRQVVTNSPVITKRFGTGGQVTTYWFDLQFPLKPPPTFVRQGLAIGGEDGITWAECEVDPVVVSRTRQALWPSAVTFALWRFTGALFLQNFMGVAKFFGYDSQADPSANMQQSMERIQQQVNKSSSPLPSQERTSDGSNTSPLPPVEKRSTGSTATPEAMGSGAGVNNDMPTISGGKDMYGYMIRTTQEHTSGPWDKFKKSLVQKWRRPQSYPPRGSIHVSGLVEITTPRAIVTVDCAAWWDPQTEAFDLKTLRMQIRALREKRQTALR
ncbi:hypothetical protein F4861DRAFT_536027 [Xylaria intraflava]|nr:hypothetical protein F4861DRAFT_536027 [Xylaria intraflava]